MSLDESLSNVERAKLAVWDYPVSDKFSKVASKLVSRFMQYADLDRFGQECWNMVCQAQQKKG